MKRATTYFRIISVAGQIGSGKTSLANELCKILNAKMVSFGDYVRSEATGRNMPLDRTSLQHLGGSLISELGYLEFVKRVLSMVEPHPFMIVDGIRHTEVWRALHSLFPKSLLVYLDITETIRLERLRDRDNLDIDSIRAAMDHPMEKNIPLLRDLADIVLQLSSISEMTAKIVKLVDEAQ